MSILQDPFEIFWDALLSREPQKIQAAFKPLDAQSRQNTLEHLKRMSTEDGWHPEQKASALAALQALNDILQ